jgi:hypothetical protein
MGRGASCVQTSTEQGRGEQKEWVCVGGGAGGAVGRLRLQEHTNLCATRPQDIGSGRFAATATTSRSQPGGLYPGKGQGAESTEVTYRQWPTKAP